MHVAGILAPCVTPRLLLWQAGAVVVLELLLAAAASSFVSGLTKATKRQAAARGAKLKT